jgi:PD-(D/E)XK nuclease superfamily
MFWQVLAGRISKKKGTANNAKNANEARINDLSKLVIGCALAVANTLGAGFLEKVYENALGYELRKRGLAVARQGGVVVRYTTYSWKSGLSMTDRKQESPQRVSQRPAGGRTAMGENGPAGGSRTSQGRHQGYFRSRHRGTEAPRHRGTEAPRRISS